MKVKNQEHIKIISIETDTIENLIESIENEYANSFKNFNLIIDLSGNKEELEEEAFENLVVQHIEEANKSFVIVAPNVDFNAFDGDLIVVPTLQEAFDLIAMDEIQRDLEFN